MKSTDPSLYLMPLLLLCLLAGPQGCSGIVGDQEDTSGGNSISSTTYLGPGSDYSLQIFNGGSFILKESDSSLKAQGQVFNLDSGINKLEVESTNLSSPAVGDEIYYIDISGYMNFMHPIGTDTQFSPMVKSSSCPSTDMTLNWVAVDTVDGSDLDGTIGATADGAESFGTLTYDVSTGTLTSTTAYDLDVDNITDLGSSALGTFSCSGGVATSGNAKGYFIDNSLVLNTDTTDDTARRILLASEQDETSDYADFSGDYQGFVYFESLDTITISGMTFSAHSSTSATLDIDEINVSTGSEINEIYDISISSAVDTPSNGLMYGTIDDNTNVACMATLNVNGSTADMIFCIGIDPTTGATDSDRFSGVFVSGK